MKSNNKALHFLPILSGLALAFSYPPFPAYFLAFTALVPLLFYFETEPRQPYRAAYVTFFLYCAISNWWIGSWQADSDPWLIASGVAIAFGHPFFFFAPVAVHLHFRKKFGAERAMWLFPFVFAAFEYARGLGDLAYTWLSLGQTQIYSSNWVQAADLIGVYGLTFLIVAANVAALKLALNILQFKRESRRITDAIFRGRGAVLTAVLAGIIILPTFYGIFRNAEYNHDKLINSRETLKIAVIQPNINPWKKWEQPCATQIAIRQHISDSVLLANPGIDLVVWDETAITFLNEETNTRHNFDFLEQRLMAHGADLLTGFSDIKIHETPEAASPVARKYNNTTKLYDAYNSAILIEPDSTCDAPPTVYHKNRLTPFGEQVPFAEYVGFATKWMEWGVGISGWTKGTELFPLKSKSGKAYSLAPIICIESVFPDYVRGFSVAGADVFAVITNDAWYDFTPGPEQHFLIAAMRAVENKRYVARSANTGVSGFIKANGETLSRVEQYKQTGLTAVVPKISEKTVYATIGDVIPLASLICIGAFLVSSAFSSIGARLARGKRK